MAQRMTTKRVAAQQNDVDSQNNRANADAKDSSPMPDREPHRFPNIVSENPMKISAR